MIEAPRALRIPVTDLALATQWYTQAFDTPPTEVRSDCVHFAIQGFGVQLALQDGSPAARTVVYWGVDDVASEHRRLLALQGGSAQALQTLETVPEGAQQALVYDPFGNGFGLTALGEPQIRRARSQRSAEKIALRNVRATLDALQREDESKRNLRRVLAMSALAALVLLALLISIVPPRTGTPLAEKSNPNHQPDKP